MNQKPEQSPGDWCIITVTHNSANDLREWWSTRAPCGPEWIVVDNASTDDTVAVAHSLGAEVIEAPGNLGFSKANNLGFRHTSARYVAFVNPDVRVNDADLPALAQLIDDQHALVAPQLLNEDGTTQPNGRGLPFLIDKFANRGLRLPGSRLDLYIPHISNVPSDVDWLTGAVICGARADLEALGPWDERFFLYYEDQEIGLAAWDHGLRVMVDPSIRWIHGWHRATKGFSVKPWLREIASATRFFRKRPIFLTLARKRAARTQGRYSQSGG